MIYSESKRILMLSRSSLPITRWRKNTTRTRQETHRKLSKSSRLFPMRMRYLWTRSNANNMTNCECRPNRLELTIVVDHNPNNRIIKVPLVRKVVGSVETAKMTSSMVAFKAKMIFTSTTRKSGVAVEPTNSITMTTEGREITKIIPTKISTRHTISSRIGKIIKSDRGSKMILSAARLSTGAVKSTGKSIIENISSGASEPQITMKSGVIRPIQRRQTRTILEENTRSGPEGRKNTVRTTSQTSILLKRSGIRSRLMRKGGPSAKPSMASIRLVQSLASTQRIGHLCGSDRGTPLRLF